MGRKGFIGEFEQVVLLAALQLRDNAHAPDPVGPCTRPWTAWREKASWSGESTPARGMATGNPSGGSASRRRGSPP